MDYYRRPASNPPTTRRREQFLARPDDAAGEFGLAIEPPQHEYLYSPQTTHYDEYTTSSESRGRSPARSHHPDPPYAGNHHGHRGHAPRGGWNKKRRQVSPETSNDLDTPQTGRQDAYSDGRREGWRDCEASLASTLARAAKDHENLLRCRKEIDALKKELQHARADVERERRSRRELEAQLRVMKETARTDSLRLAAIASRPAVSSRDPDIEMPDIDAAPVVHLPGGRVVATAPIAGAPLQNSPHAQVSPPGRSAGGGGAGGNQQRRTFQQYKEDKDKRGHRQKNTAPGAQDNTREPGEPRWREHKDNFGDVPEDMTEFGCLVRKAQSPGGHTAVWAMKKYRRAAQQKEANGEQLADNEHRVLLWRTSKWYKKEQDELQFSPITVMTPPGPSHPFPHWHKHFLCNRESRRKGLLRDKDGNPDLSTLEGLFITSILIQTPDRESMTFRNRMLLKLAELFSDPVKYEERLERLEIDPAEELDYQPYLKGFPATIDQLCQHAAACGITSWDVQHTLRAWALEFLRGEMPPPTLVPSAASVAQPTRASSPVEDEAPSELSSGSADLAGDITIKSGVDPLHVPLPSVADVDMEESSAPDDPGNVSA